MQRPNTVPAHITTYRAILDAAEAWAEGITDERARHLAAAVTKELLTGGHLAVQPGRCLCDPIGPDPDCVWHGWECPAFEIGDTPASAGPQLTCADMGCDSPHDPPPPGAGSLANATVRLCDDDGLVSDERVTPPNAFDTDLTYLRQLNNLRSYTGLAEYAGPTISCTGSVHLAGMHIRCTSPAHTKP